MKEDMTFHASRQDSAHERITEYDTLRALLILLVVLGHCTYYSIMTEYGGVDFGGIMTANNIPDALAHKFFSLISDAIYSFHMPLFMVLSGALFGKSAKASFLELLRVKSWRLIFPFIIVTTFVSVPLKYLAGYWDGSADILRDVFVGQYLTQGNTHLWFLVTLFFVMILTWLINRHFTGTKSRLCVIVCLVAVHVCARFAGITLLHNVMSHALWFYAGFVFAEYRGDCNRRITAGTFAAFFMLWAALFLSERYMPHDSLVWKAARNIAVFLVCCAGMSWCYCLCFLLNDSPVSRSRITQFMCSYSLGIYLYSDTFNYNIIHAFVSMFGINALYTNSGATLLYVMRFILTLGLSIVITRLLKHHHAKFIA